MDSDSPDLVEKFTDQRFIGLLIIVLASIAGIFMGVMSDDVFQYTVLIAYLVFSGAESIDYGSFVFNKRKERTERTT